MAVTNWKALAISEANRQNCPIDIALATVEAETSGVNEIGDNGNALGFGQVWPAYHMDKFRSQATQLGLSLPESINGLKQLVLSNDRYSMAVAVATIKEYWGNCGGNWAKFTYGYVGPAIPQSDFNRRQAIWQKYSGNSNSESSLYTNVDYGTSSSFPGDNITIPSTNYGVVPNSTVLGDILYGRKYRVLISNNKSGTALDVSQLRCTFNIVKTLVMQPNYSQIDIYNLSAETENILIEEGNRVVLEAGYEGKQYGLIFDGNVIQPIRDKEDGVTFKLSLVALDGDRFINGDFVNFSLTRGQTKRSVIKNCIARATNPIQLGSISDSLSNNSLPRGKVMFGMTRDYLRQIAQGENCTFYVNNGKANIVHASDLPEGEIIELSPQTGLIGVPAQNEYGVTFKCLMNPRIDINTLVHIDNSLVRAQAQQWGQVYRTLDNDGIYRVIKATYTGDTRGDDWYVQCDTVTQAGYLPSMASNSNLNLW